MNHTFYGFSCGTPNAELRAVVEYGMKYVRDLIGRQPVAVHMHPQTITRYIAVHGPWPDAWPTLFPNDGMDRQIVGIEPGAKSRTDAQQLRLI